MRLTLPAAFLCASIAFAAVCAAAAPHGGGYRNPPGFIPRKAAPVGEGATKRPDSPLAPPQPDNGSGPRTGGASPGPVGPGMRPPAGGSGPSTGGGIVLGPDPTRWQDWWELNRDPFLRLREAVRAPSVVTGSAEFFMGAGRQRGSDTRAPTDEMVRELVAPQLRALLEGDPHRDLETAAMVALAKVGQDRAPFDVVPLLEERLRDPDQEVRETAALALGLCGSPQAIDILDALVLDTEAARLRVERGRVEDRVRAFAAYGLAFAARAAGVELQTDVVATLRGLLDGATDDRDLQVAVILGIGLAIPAGSGGAVRRLRAGALEELRAVWDRSEGPGFDVVRCHAATSLARLLADEPAESVLAAFHAGRFASVLADADVGDDLKRAAALALGTLGPRLESAQRASCARALIDASRTAKDHQVRYFAFIGLGGVGGDEARSYLLEQLATGTRALVRPWAALGLGLLVHATGDDATDATVAAALAAQLDEVRTPDARAAFAVALGLCRAEAEADALRALLDELASQDDVAGHFCTALALLGDDRAIPRLRELVQTSARRPQRLRDAAVALGALGDHEAAELLIAGLRDGRPTLAQVASIATGLGLIGDRRSVEPLLALAADDSAPDLARAFAVVALGQIVERSSLPWNTPLAVGTNYRAAVETLIDGVRGILDLH
ncbi:MAG: hypothetical protein RL562_2217 [Planctomycetota bacterium]